MTIQEICANYLQAREIESRLAQQVQSRYDMQAHYAACDRTSYWAVQMINHKDWTTELADEIYPSSIGEIAYPVSC